MKTLFVASIFMALSTAAFAAAPLCFERQYDAAHMVKHKLQEVTKIKLELLQSGPRLKGTISAGFREITSYLHSDVNCDVGDKNTLCSVKNAVGSFSFTPTPQGIKLTNTSQIRFGGEDEGVTIGREIEHKVFLLFKTACGG